MCEEASANLEDFYAILSFDDFSNEVAVFFKEHGIPFKEIAHERKAKYPPPTAEERALIAAHNQYDIALFEKWVQRKASIV